MYVAFYIYSIKCITDGQVIGYGFMLLYIFYIVIHWLCVWKRLTLCWLCPRSFSHYISNKSGRQQPPLPHRSKWGVPCCYGAYLRDYQHENTTSQFSAGGWSVIVSCQTSRVALTASYLTFSSKEFIFQSLVFLQLCHLWPNLAPFFPLHHVHCEPVIKLCVKIALFMKREHYPHQEKVTSCNWWAAKCTSVLWDCNSSL